MYMARGLVWNEQEDKILLENYNKIPSSELLEMLPNRTYYSLVNRARTIGCNDKGNHSHKKYSVNEYFFHEITKDNSYWAGFLAADGTIYDSEKNSDFRISIKLQARDVCILETFKEVVKFTGNIRTYNRSTNFGKNCLTSNINICGVKQWVQDLKNNFNVISNKSIVLKAPVILNEEQSLAYIKGYLDGNGSISLSKKGVYHFQILTTENVGYWTKNVLEKKFNSFISISPYSKTKGMFIVAKSGKKAEEILNYLNENISFGLDRKWQKLSPLAKQLAK